MVRYVITRQGKLFLVASLTERGYRKPIVTCATEQEAIEYRRSLQDQADAAELRGAVLPRP
jgi:hypothetical protein